MFISLIENLQNYLSCQNLEYRTFILKDTVFHSHNKKKFESFRELVFKTQRPSDLKWRCTFFRVLACSNTVLCTGDF